MLYYCTYGGLSTYTYVYTLYVYRLFSRETLLTTFGALEAETRSGDGVRGRELVHLLRRRAALTINPGEMILSLRHHVL